MIRPARFAWLVLAHADAEQLSALLARLVPAGSPDFAVVHLDRKSPLWREGRGAFLARHPNVRLIARPVAVHWAHHSQLSAIRLLLRETLREDFTHAHLVSGADWPLATRETMLADLARAGERDCGIEAAPGVQDERMRRISLHARWLRPDPARPLAVRREYLLRRLSARLPGRGPGPWGQWHKGSTWWSLPRDVCQTVARELDRGFARGTFLATQCADEHAIQTIVARACPHRLAPPRRHVVWDGDWSPRTLTAADWPEAVASGAWLARKLARAVDPFFLSLPWPAENPPGLFNSGMAPT